MTIEEAWRWVDKAITAGVSAKMANWCADEDEGEQLAHADHKRDIARRVIELLVAQARDEALEEAAKVCDLEMESALEIGKSDSATSTRRAVYTAMATSAANCRSSIRARIAGRKA